MAADDEISAMYRFVRQELAGSRPVVTGDRDYRDLNQTSPEKAFYWNGGNPTNAGRTVPAPNAVFQPGQRMVLQIKPRATKTLDSTGGTSADIRVNILKRDLATGALFPAVLTDTDRDTTQLADDGSKVASVWSDAYHWLVPLGEVWQLYGETKIRSSTTA